MNNKRRNIWIVVVAVMLITATLLYFHFKTYLPKYRWTENYYYNSDQPYGLKLAVEILSESYPKRHFIFADVQPNKIVDKQDTGALYMFIGENFVCDSTFSQSLASFVKRGNNAFISNITAEHSLFKILTFSTHSLVKFSYFNDSIARINFDTISRGYRFDYKYNAKPTKYKWLGINKSFLKDSLSFYGFEKVSSLNGILVDCWRVQYGKGWFIFHCNPLFFTNYSLSKQNGFDYINCLLSDYRKNTLIWDEFSKSPQMYSSITSTQESPLRFILSERSLSWAWYLICLFSLLFIVVNSKRKQALIPLLPANNNTTREFIKSIAMLYFRKNAKAYLAEEMMKQFLSFVKHKYGLSPGLEKKEIPSLLAPLSGIPSSDLEKMFLCYKELQNSYADEKHNLKELYRLIEHFYKNCK